MSVAQRSGTPEVIAGRFESLGVLHQDGFGDVLKALDRKTNKQVSLRQLRSEPLASAARAVLRALGTFSHPNVVPTFGVVAAPEGAVLVQGPLAGQHLAAFVTARTAGGKPVSLRGAYNVVAHVCNALTAVHATGPHGGLRPGCIWIGEDGRVQLADLVIARAALSRGGTAGLAEAEAAYLAP